MGASAGLAALRTTKAVQHGAQAKSFLLRAEIHLRAGQVDAARSDLQHAQQGFGRMRQHLDGLGPVGPVARITPFLRVQLRGVEGIADAGRLLAGAGLQLTDAAAAVHQSDQTVPFADALNSLRHIQGSLESGTSALRAATERVASLNGYRLVGPIASARAELATDLPAIQARAEAANRGLEALIVFVGGSGPRRYLFLSQNPAELRPSGGFIGTYGVLTADGQRLSLDRFDAIENWTSTHPEAQIAPADAGSPFGFIAPPFPQTLANVNTVPDWPRVATLAMDLWRRGGEAPVDGVVSVSTGFLARILTVIGPTLVPAYEETVTAANVVERMDFYARQPTAGRKDFVGAVAEAALRGLLAAPARQWQELGGALGQAFDAREAMAWTTDAPVTRVLAERAWDGTLPAGPGDFFFGGEFAFATKNGRGIHRAYDHHVAARPDGSALVTTVVTFTNTDAEGRLNAATPTYVTLYGPESATLDAGADPAVALEPPLGGHPAAGWFRAAPPLGTVDLKVVWDVSRLLRRNADDAWFYDLRWIRVPDHAGDTLRLRVDLPPGWRWQDSPPPAIVDLTHDVVGSWEIQAPKGSAPLAIGSSTQTSRRLPPNW